MDLGISNMKDLFELIGYIVVALGIPFFIYQFNLERKDREYGTFDSLDDKYTEFQEICMQYPELNIHDIPFEKDQSISKTDLKNKQEEAALWILMSIFERAYLMYKRHSRKSREGQFDGWVHQMELWYRRDNFQSAWQKLDVGDYDKEFMQWFEEIVIKPYETKMS
ncbi:MAG: hypothetical protein Q9M30_09460 [Mariprofundaceae bacterium]|nr:hypothetical protein [Mariprofundaceae bacterium]